MLSVVIQALKRPVMFLCMLCTPFANRRLIYSGWAFESTHLTYTSHHHLITTVFVIKRLSLYEFTLWGRDLVSVVHIRESLLWTFCLKENIYDNFVGTLETVHNRAVSIARGSTVPYL